MRSIATVLIAVSATGTICGCEQKPKRTPAPAPASATATTGENAADLYRSTWSKISSDLHREAGSVSFSSSGPQVDATGGSWEEVSRALRADQGIVEDLIRASAMERCDFEIRPEIVTDEAVSGPVLELSGNLRKTGRILRADAIRAWMEGDVDGAVERLAALYRFVGQMSRTPVVIVALTDAALLSLANDTAQTMAAGVGGKSLSPAQRRRLLEEIDRLDQSDPIGLAGARRVEGDANAEQARQMDGLQRKTVLELRSVSQAMK